jgi:DNA invertase Pin-like site-specific DNA recombinase
MERGIIGERTKAALKYKRANGKKTGGDIPFGYYLDADGQTLLTDPAEQEVISLIKELRREACSLKAICQELKHRGFPTKTGVDGNGKVYQKWE